VIYGISIPKAIELGVPLFAIQLGIITVVSSYYHLCQQVSDFCILPYTTLRFLDHVETMITLGYLLFIIMGWNYSIPTRFRILFYLGCTGINLIFGFLWWSVNGWYILSFTACSITMLIVVVILHGDRTPWVRIQQHTHIGLLLLSGLFFAVGGGILFPFHLWVDLDTFVVTHGLWHLDTGLGVLLALYSKKCPKKHMPKV